MYRSMAGGRDPLGKLESRWALAQQVWALPVIGGALGGVVAAFTDFMSTWAPFSWFVGAIVGGLGFQGWALLRSWQGERSARAKRIEMLEPPKGHVSLAAERFEYQRIYMPDLLLPGQRTIEGKEFVGCELVGPVNVVLGASSPGSGKLERCGFFFSDGVVFNPEHRVQNAVVLLDCIFKNCKMYHWTLLFPEGEREFMKERISGLTVIN
jgi:hypothetical protein